MRYKDPQKNKEARMKGWKVWAERHPEQNKRRIKNGNLRRSFGIGIDEYEQMHAAQNGLCAICQRPERHSHKGVTPALCADHDHTTGKVRALLCMDCNRGIGCFDENILITTAALEYLKKHLSGEN